MIYLRKFVQLRHKSIVKVSEVIVTQLVSGCLSTLGLPASEVSSTLGERRTDTDIFFFAKFLELLFLLSGQFALLLGLQLTFNVFGSNAVVFVNDAAFVFGSAHPATSPSHRRICAHGFPASFVLSAHNCSYSKLVLVLRLITTVCGLQDFSARFQVLRVVAHTLR